MSTMLLVDDDLDNLWALQLALEASGHRVVLAHNGADALQRLLSEVPQLIVMLSALAEPGEGPPCWSAFFRKPADLEVLMRTVDRYAADRLATTPPTLTGSDLASSRWRSVNPRCWP